MPDETTKLVLEHLQSISSKVESIEEGLGWIGQRLASVESRFESLVATSTLRTAELAKIDGRLESIDRRLELSEN